MESQVDKEEIWKDVEGWEGRYQISNLGRVKRVERYTYVNHPTSPYYRFLKEIILQLKQDKDGYYTVTFDNQDIGSKNCKVHRVVANAFIENKDNLPQINHKDGNKHNNRVDNLEWCDDAYNNNHAIQNGLRHMQKIGRVDPENDTIIQIFESLPSVLEFDPTIDLSTIVKVCKHKRKYHHGFSWIYATPDMKVGDKVA